MNLLLEFAIKISLVVALGLLAAALVRRRSAALRHGILAAFRRSVVRAPIVRRMLDCALAGEGCAGCCCCSRRVA